MGTQPENGRINTDAFWTEVPESFMSCNEKFDYKMATGGPFAEEAE